MSRADQILDAAGQLFAREGVGRPGMEAVAHAAGCSRATLYRYYTDKDALLRAFVRREADAIVAEVGMQPSEVDLVLALLAAVRSRPHLRAWYVDADPALLPRFFREAPLIPELAADHGRWILRIVMSFLREPEQDPAVERRLLERFLVS